MPTVTKSIKGDGTGDYTTVAAWEAALPANLVTDGNSQAGEVYHTGEYSVAGTVVTFSGSTTDATHTITLRAATGQGFRDHANIQSNALCYNASNGAAIACTGSYLAGAIVISEDYVTIQGLQVKQTAAGSQSFPVVYVSSSSYTNTVLEHCIFEGVTAAAFNGIVSMPAGTIRNCVVVSRLSSGSNGVYFGYPAVGTKAVNVTVVRPSDLTAAASAFAAEAANTAALTNCAGFGFTNFVNVAARFTGSNNASDAAIGFGTSNQASKTYTAQFQNTLDATRDFRIKTGADCVDTGVTDATNAATDIAGTSRPSGSAYDIGAWELVQAGGGGGGSHTGLTLLGVG